MAIEASFVVEHSDFPLSAVFDDVSTVSVELDRVVPTTDSVVPYLWFYTDDPDAIVTEFDDDIGIEQVRVVDTMSGQLFVRIDWNLDHESILTAIVHTDVSIVSGIGTPDHWTFEIRANDQQDLTDFQTYCRDHDIPIELTQLHSLSPLVSGREYDLTTGQREVLELAYAHGYFDSPRNASQDDLAEELGISRQAVSARLQRGIHRLVAETLITSDD